MEERFEEFVRIEEGRRKEGKGRWEFVVEV